MTWPVRAVRAVRKGASRAVIVAGLFLLGAPAASTACSRGADIRANAGKGLKKGSGVSPDGGARAASPSASRPGMAYIPPGLLLAGTPVDRAPRVAEEELPGTRVEMGEFFIDLLPFPNEAGAIATTNVTRDEAAAACAGRQKRLCSELEWERACKGPANTTYEDGDEFHATTCGLGQSAELAAKRPSGDLTACVGGFGTREQHGGAWEWTDSNWGRGGRSDLGVLKGGNATAGEIAGRCANSLARAPGTKSPSMGFRCCAGVRNDAKADLPVKVYPALERSMKTAALTAPWLAVARETWKPELRESDESARFSFVHAFVWHPVGNETLVVATGCAKATPRPRCGLLVGRTLESEGGGPDDPRGGVRVLAHVDTGVLAAEVAEAGEAKHLRFKGADATSAYLRDFSYVYGRIVFGEARR